MKLVPLFDRVVLKKMVEEKVVSLLERKNTPPLLASMVK